MDPLDGPLVAVVDQAAVVGAQVSVVAAGHDLISDMEPIPAGWD
jgi:hypothetical protein